MKAYDPRITSTVALVALMVWVGGLLTLGAIVAPLVFASVPFGLAADTMAVVFARYDKLAMAAAAVVLATEAIRASGEQREGAVKRGQAARVGVTLVLAGLAVLEGMWITPTIANLHAEGAVRGVGEAGAALASAHSLAERIGQAQALLAIVLVALHVGTMPSTSAPALRADGEVEEGEAAK